MTFQGHQRLEWTLAIVGCAVIAAWITLGDFLDEMDADHVVPVMVSLQRWTRYYWGQDRLGMLVPLIALPVRSPFANLLVQCGLTVFAALMTFVLGARALSHRPGAVLAGMITTTLFFLTASRELIHYLAAPSQPYGVSLALTFAALICLDQIPVTRARAPRLAAGVLLLTLALFVNLALVVLVGPFLVLRGLPHLRALLAARRPVLSWWRDPSVFGLLAFGFAAATNLISAKTSPYAGATQFGVLPPADWPRGWATFFERTIERLPSGWLLVMAMATAAVVVFVAVPSPRGITRDELIASASALAVAVCAWLLVGALQWVRANGYGYNYGIPSLVFAFVAVVGFAFTRVTLTPRMRVRLIVVCLVLLGASAAHDHGVPSVRERRRFLDRFGEHTEALLRSGATHLTGNYWMVWPALLHAEIVRHERGLDGVLYGITDRAGPTRKCWRDWPPGRFRVAMRTGDEQEAAFWFREIGVPPLEPSEQVDGLTIYTAPR